MKKFIRKNNLRDYKLKELLPHLRGPKILDLGCGHGLFVDYLQKHLFKATGVDLSSKLITYAQKNLKGKYILGDATKLPFPSQSFDTVMLINVLEHIPHQLKALREALRVGKKIILVVPQQTPENLIDSGVIFKHHLDPTHCRVYTVRSLSQSIIEAGGKIEKLIFVEKLPERKLMNQLYKSPPIIKKIVNRIFYFVFPPTSYYLEIMAIISHAHRHRRQ